MAVVEIVRLVSLPSPRWKTIVIAILTGTSRSSSVWRAVLAAGAVLRRRAPPPLSGDAGEHVRRRRRPRSSENWGEHSRPQRYPSCSHRVHREIHEGRSRRKITHSFFSCSSLWRRRSLQENDDEFFFSSRFSFRDFSHLLYYYFAFSSHHNAPENKFPNFFNCSLSPAASGEGATPLGGASGSSLYMSPRMASTSEGKRK